MAKMKSSMLPLGTAAPEFLLLDVVTGQYVSPKPAAKATLIMFICNHCPYVKHISKGLVQLAKDYHEKGVRFIAINANDIARYPDDSPENMKKIALEQGYSFPYLFDETQEVAKAFQATCTPDFFLFDKQLQLVYRGQFDDSRPGNALAVTGLSIREALERLLHNEPLLTPQKPSLGCSIKWKN